MRDVTAVFVGPVGKPERCNWHRSNGYDACDVCGAKERFKKLLLAPLGRVGTVMQKEPNVNGDAGSRGSDPKAVTGIVKNRRFLDLPDRRDSIQNAGLQGSPARV